MMENTYGVGVKNRYELFYDDEEEDPLEILRQQEEENERRKTDKLQKEKVKSGTGKIVKQPPSKSVIVKETAPRGPGVGDVYRPRTKPGVERAPRFEDSRALEERKNFRNREEKPSSNAAIENREWRGGEGEMRRGRGGPRGGRGGGRGRGRGGTFGFDNRGKREFDRQSGSDRSSVKPFEKRDGGGAHNWGTVKDDLDVQLTPFGEENQEGGERSGDEVPENPQLKEGEQPPGEEVKEATEDIFREMTLDEWKKEQKVKRSVPKFNLRKAGEGEDGTQWKKLFLLKKKVGEEDDEDEDEETDDEDYVRRGRQKTRVDIEINFTDSRGRGRGRGRGAGGRGGGRGGPPPGAEAGDAQPSRKVNKSPLQQSAPKVDDWNDFPSLVAA